MSLLHQIWFQSLHTGQALLERHNWSIFEHLNPFWRPQKGNFMSILIPFVAPDSHKSNLLAPEKIIRWPKVTRSWYMIFVVKHDPFLNHWSSFRCPNKSIWNPSNGQYSIQSDQNALHLWWPPRWSIVWHLGPNLIILGIWWSLQGPKGWICDYWGRKGDQFAHKIALLGPSKGPQWPKNGSRMPINAWPVCRLWNHIWCHKDIQRVKSALHGVMFILTWFPLIVGAYVNYRIITL